MCQTHQQLDVVRGGADGGCARLLPQQRPLPKESGGAIAPQLLRAATAARSGQCVLGWEAKGAGEPGQAAAAHPLNTAAFVPCRRPAQRRAGKPASCYAWELEAVAGTRPSRPTHHFSLRQRHTRPLFHNVEGVTLLALQRGKFMQNFHYMHNFSPATIPPATENASQE